MLMTKLDQRPGWLRRDPTAWINRGIRKDLIEKDGALESNANVGAAEKHNSSQSDCGQYGESPASSTPRQT
jgi:hypothetical protein